jgi:hypothetical protein
VRELFRIHLDWFHGLGQLIIYVSVALIILWLLSKVELPDRGDTPSERESK